MANFADFNVGIQNVFPVYLNVDDISSFQENSTGSVIYMKNGDKIKVIEKPEKIIKIIDSFGKN